MYNRDLTPDQKNLIIYMQVLSEYYYDAGWATNLEYSLWDALSNKSTTISPAHLYQLREASRAANGWAICPTQEEVDHGPEDPIIFGKFVPMQWWLDHVSARKREE